MPSPSEGIFFEANPAFRYKSSFKNLFLQATKRASVGRCFAPAKNRFLNCGLSASIGAIGAVCTHPKILKKPFADVAFKVPQAEQSKHFTFPIFV